MLNITHIILNLSPGGAENLLINMIKKNNIKLNHHILVIGKKQNNLNVDGNVTYLNYNLMKYFLFILKNKNQNMILKYWLHNVFILSIIPILFGNYKIILFVHNELISIRYLGIKNFIFCFFNKLISKIFMINILFCSQSSRYHHLNFGFKGKTSVIHNFIDQKKYNFKLKKNFDLNSRFKLVMVANNTNAKNHYLLIKILSNINKKKYFCDLFGLNIKNDKKLVKLITKYGLGNNIRLKDFKNSKNLYSRYDFSFLISNTESFPMVILESICEGTLCIASNVGDISKIITNRKFLIDNTRNINIHVKKIKTLFDLRLDSKKYNKISSDFLLDVQKKFDLGIIYPKYYKFWSEL